MHVGDVGLEEVGDVGGVGSVGAVAFEEGAAEREFHQLRITRKHHGQPGQHRPDEALDVGVLTRAGRPGDGQRWGWAGAAAFGIVLLSSIGALESLIREIALALISPNSVMAVTYTMIYIGMAMSPLLLIAMFVIIARQQRRLSAD